MHNILPFIYPYNNFNDINQNDLERIINKLERLEKNIRILDNRLTNIEKKYKADNQDLNDNSNDMYII